MLKNLYFLGTPLASLKLAVQGKQNVTMYNSELRNCTLRCTIPEYYSVQKYYSELKVKPVSAFMLLLVDELMQY